MQSLRQRAGRGQAEERYTYRPEQSGRVSPATTGANSQPAHYPRTPLHPRRERRVRHPHEPPDR